MAWKDVEEKTVSKYFLVANIIEKAEWTVGRTEKCFISVPKLGRIPDPFPVPSLELSPELSLSFFFLRTAGYAQDQD